MPDDRLIHLTLGHSEKINGLTDFERLVWLMYKLASDDFGVMRFSAVTLRESADWLSHKPERLVQRALDEVRKVGLVQSFEHQRRTYCYQWDWQKWQKISYPRPTIQPAPPAEMLDRDTQWLMSHHPRGGKIHSWKAPKEFVNLPRVILGTFPETSQNFPRTFRECICVGVCVCVGVCKEQDQNLPTPKARRDSRSVEKLLKTPEGSDDATVSGLQADRIPSALCRGEDAASTGADDRRCGVEGADTGSPANAGIRRTGPGATVSSDDTGGIRHEADDRGSSHDPGSASAEGYTGAVAGILHSNESAAGMGSGAVAHGEAPSRKRLEAIFAEARAARGPVTH